MTRPQRLLRRLPGSERGRTGEIDRAIGRHLVSFQALVSVNGSVLYHQGINDVVVNIILESLINRCKNALITIKMYVHYYVQNYVPGKVFGLIFIMSIGRECLYPLNVSHTMPLPSPTHFTLGKPKLIPNTLDWEQKSSSSTRNLHQN